ncbi:ATP-binding protein [Corynebacterium pyruviciproducens]
MVLAQRIEDGIAIDVEQLSGGAKEQLTLIVRLALAEVAAKSGAQVPIFIDDFLGHSDQGRIDDMAALINMISARHQIFILTCFPSRFAGVANAHSYRIDELTG